MREKKKEHIVLITLELLPPGCVGSTGDIPVSSLYNYSLIKFGKSCSARGTGMDAESYPWKTHLPLRALSRCPKDAMRAPVLPRSVPQNSFFGLTEPERNVVWVYQDS